MSLPLRPAKQATDISEPGKLSLRGGEDAPFLPRKRLKLNNPPKHKRSANKSSAKSARLTQDAFLTRREQQDQYIKQETDDEEALFTRSDREYQRIKQEEDDQDTRFTRLQQKYQNVRQERDELDTSFDRLHREYQNVEKERDKLDRRFTRVLLKYREIKQERDDQDALVTQLRQRCREIKRKRNELDALFDQIHQKYQNVKEERDDWQERFQNLNQERDDLYSDYTWLQRIYRQVKQKKDSAKELIEFLQQRLEDSDRDLEELQKEITESKRKDLEICLLRDELLEAQKELQEYREAERQKALEDTIDENEIPTDLPLHPSREGNASPGIKFLSQREMEQSRNNLRRSTAVSWHLETTSDELVIWNGPIRDRDLELIADPSPYITVFSSHFPCIPTFTSPNSQKKGGWWSQIDSFSQGQVAQE